MQRIAPTRKIILRAHNVRLANMIFGDYFLCCEATQEIISNFILHGPQQHEQLYRSG
jgi:hypothetical protein